MARGKKKVEEKIDFRSVQWVLNNLSETELQEMDGLGLDLPAVMEKIGEMVGDGWKISARYDDYSDAVQVTATMLTTGNLNAGLAISGRSDDLADCFLIVAYKFFYVAEGDLKQYSQEPGGRRVRG